MHDTGYDYRYDDYDYPLVAQWDARDLDELSVLFEQGFEDVPFTAAEEEMLPVDCPWDGFEKNQHTCVCPDLTIN